MPEALIPDAVKTTAEALLIGFLVGAQREAAREPDEVTPGVRDFVLIALVGAVCALLRAPWLTVAALACITALLAVFHVLAHGQTGITTEMAAISTFCLAYLTAAPEQPHGSALAIGITVAVVTLLEAKPAIHRFVRETITHAEFDDTLRFLALVFIVYPVLPAGQYGPYGFLAPRALWLFVILVCSISYVGYFLEKFLGTRVALRLSGILGGLASSTAATGSLARSAGEEPDKAGYYWQAALFANAIQFPRVLAILALIDTGLARLCLAPLASMSLAGFAFGLLVGPRKPLETERVRLRSPFRLMPALQFAGILLAIILATKAAAAQFGAGAIYWTSLFGGSVDADAAVVSLSDLVRLGTVPPGSARLGIMLALAGNAVVKTLIAAHAGTRGFARRVAAGFAIMFGAGFAAWTFAGWA